MRLSELYDVDVLHDLFRRTVPRLGTSSLGRRRVYVARSRRSTSPGRSQNHLNIFRATPPWRKPDWAVRCRSAARRRSRAAYGNPAAGDVASCDRKPNRTDTNTTVTDNAGRGCGDTVAQRGRSERFGDQVVLLAENPAAWESASRPALGGAVAWTGIGWHLLSS